MLRVQGGLLGAPVPRLGERRVRAALVHVNAHQSGPLGGSDFALDTQSECAQYSRLRRSNPNTVKHAMCCRTVRRGRMAGWTALGPRSEAEEEGKGRTVHEGHR
jgi:hypothetical protein